MKRPANMHFRTLLALVVLLPLGLASIAIIITMYATASRNSTAIGEHLLAAATSRAAQQTYAQSKLAADLTRSATALADNGLNLDDSDKLAAQFLALLRAHQGITWISYSNHDGTFTGAYRDAKNRTCTNQSHIIDGKTTLIEYAVDSDGTKTVIRQDNDSGYDPRTRSFYIEAARSRDIVWLPPYIFYGQGIPGISCACAVRKGSPEPRGVISVDYDLNSLSEFAANIAASPHSQVMIFTPDLILIAHSSLRVVSTGGQRGVGKLLTLKDVEDPLTHVFYEQIQNDDLKKFTPSATKFITFSQEDTPYIGCIMPVQLDAGPFQYVATIAPKYDFAPTPWQFARTPILISVAVLIAAAAAALLLAKRITTPVTTLVKASQQVGTGKLDVTVNLGSIYEFQVLSNAFHRMLANLREWFHVRTALNFAMDVQRRLLPAYPPMIVGFDISGYCSYCDETGGDYYDYIIIDRLGTKSFLVALGDVMGHGVSSALLMAGARGILRSCVSTQIAPGAILTHMNSLLFQDTGGEQFMTFLLASFDLNCAGCLWASAGHDPPIIYDPIDKIFQEPEGGDFPLGIADCVEYGNYRFGPLSTNQIIAMGTDGLWETLSPTGESFGKNRLKRVIAANADACAEDIKDAILIALSDFRGTAPIKDDITFVIIKEASRQQPPPPPPPPVTS